ncbi:MAG: 50S ribosomal protein L7/L12 [Patescibacteria group bacterium]
MSKVSDVLEIVKGMTVLELNELVKAFEEEFGVSAAAPVAFAAAPAAAAAAPAEAEKTEFNVVLVSAGDKKIQVIKAVKEATGLSLTDAKNLVDAAPKAVKEGLSRKEAEELQAKLQEAGATIELK